MEKSLKRLLSFAMALMMVLSLVPFNALEVYAAEEDNGNMLNVSTKAELDAAIQDAEDSDTIVMTADIDYGVAQLKIEKAITLDLGGKTLTNSFGYGGMSLKGNCTVKNGTIDHKGGVAAIKAWNVVALEDLTIAVAERPGKTVGGIVIQEGTASRIGSIKNVTIQGEGLTNGIETYNCGNATEPVIGSMENVTIDATATGMLISAPCGTAKNCTISGGKSGIELWIKGTYSATLDLIDCDVAGGDQAVYVHDEFNSNPGVVNNGALKLTADEATAFTSESGVPLTLTIARAENVELPEKLIENFAAKVNGTYYTTLAEAVAAANAVEGGATVTLLTNVTLGEKLTVSGNVTISGEKTITRADSYTGTLFAVNAGATLTLDGGLTIDGGNNYAFDKVAFDADAADWNTSIAKEDSAKWFTPEEGAPVASAFMITTTGGTVNLNKVTIQNNYSVGSGVVSAGANSTIDLTGAKITHVAATQGNGVAVNASGAGIKVNMNEGTVIDSNHVGGNHGIFKIYSGTVFTMNGGEITNNTGWNSNGTAVGVYWGTFCMKGGKICSNTGVYGPNNGRNAAIYLHSGHTFEMTGGTICCNSGRARGGIDAPYDNGTAKISGGEVLDNISRSDGTTPDVLGTSAMEITGGTFTQDVSEWLAPNTGLTYDAYTGTYTTTEHIYNLYFRDPSTGEQVADVGPLQGNDLASLIATGKLFYADYYKMELEVLSNVVIDETVVIDYPMTINLNGKTIKTTKQAEDTYVDAFTILADVTVTGEGKIDARPSNGYTFYIGDKQGTAGNLTIENGIFYGETSVAQVTTGSLTINGGKFAVDPYVEEGKEDNYNFLLNCLDASYKNSIAKIEVNGGIFYKFDPADNAAEGTNTSFVADGYLVEANDDYYSVRAVKYIAQVGDTKYESLTEAIEAAKAAETTVTVLDTVVLTEDGTLDLQGVRINAAETLTNTPVFRILANVTVTNGIVDGGSGINSYAFIVGNNDTAGTLTIADGTYRGVTSAISITKGTVNISGGTFQTTHDDEGTDYGTQYLLNCMDAAYKNGTAVYNITGGKFVGFNPENNAAEGAGTNFLAGNYKASDYYGDDKWYVAEANVVMDGAKYFATIKDALATLKSADTTVHTVKVLTDLEIDVNYSTYNYPILVNGFAIELDLNGKTITADWSKYTGTRKDNALIGIANGGKLTIDDSVGTGKIINNDTRDDVENRIIWAITSTATKELHLTINSGIFIQNDKNTALLYVQGNKPADNLAPMYVHITGGHFESVNDDFFNAYDWYEHESTITGGTFNKNPRDWEIVIPEEYAPVQLADGSWGIGTAVASVGTYGYYTLQEAIDAAGEGNIINVIADHVVTDPVVIEKNVTIDLNGKTITGENVYPVIRVQNGANVTVKNGTITNDDYVFVLGSSDQTTAGNLTIESGSYTGLTTVASVTKGTLTIKGGEFAVSESEYGATYLLNCYDSSAKDETAKIVVTGGTFTGFNPEDNAAENPKVNFCADGYVAVDNGDNTYTVVSYVEWVKAQLLAGNDVTLEHDILITDYSLVNALKLPSNGNGKYNEVHGNGAVFHVIKPGVELDLNGHSIVWDAHHDDYCNKRQVSLFLVTGTGVEGETADLTIKDSVGTGKVDVYGMGTGLYVLTTDAKGTIQGGSWTNCPCKTCDASNIFLYPSHGGTMEITGGTFEQKDSEYLLGWKGSSKPTTESNVGVDYDATKVVISGGTFVNFDPENVKFFDTANSGQVTIDGCAPGYKAVDNGDGTYNVVINERIVAWNMQTGAEYETVAQALQDAKENETVQLLADSNEAGTVLTVLNGITLDLNGHTLTAYYAMTATVGSYVIDSTNGEGLLKVAKDNLILADNTQLKIWMEEEGGYRFDAVTFGTYLTTKNGTTEFWFWMNEPKGLVMKELADGAADNDGLSVRIKMTYTNSQGGTSTLYFDFPAEKIQEYAHYEFTGTASSMKMYISNLDTVTDVSFVAMVTSGSVAVESTEVFFEG